MSMEELLPAHHWERPGSTTSCGVALRTEPHCAVHSPRYRPRYSQRPPQPGRPWTHQYGPKGGPLRICHRTNRMQIHMGSLVAIGRTGCRPGVTPSAKPWSGHCCRRHAHRRHCSAVKKSSATALPLSRLIQPPFDWQLQARAWRKPVHLAWLK